MARIGVRGTIGDLLVEAGRTIAVVQQGVLIACSINNQCTELSRPGEAAVVTATSVMNEGVGGAGGWSFASLCAGDLCEATRFASLQPPPGGYLTLSGKFDGEFGRGATALAGAGQLRWSW